MIATSMRVGWRTGAPAGARARRGPVGRELRALVVGAGIGALLLSAPVSSWASSQSLVTGGLGLDIGLARSVLGGEGSTEMAVAELSARVRLFRILGVSFAYDPAATDLPLATSFSLSGQIFFAPTRWFSLYLLGGIGSRAITDLGDGGGATTSYHAGGGLEVYVGRRFAISLEYRWLIPGARTVLSSAAGQVTRQLDPDVAAAVQAAADSGDLSSLADSEEARALVESGELPSQTDVDISPWDYLNGGNFELVIGLRFYI